MYICLSICMDGLYTETEACATLYPKIAYALPCPWVPLCVSQFCGGVRGMGVGAVQFDDR